MKFANYRFRARGVNNLGDQMQIIAIDHIYQSMGMKREDIVGIDYHHLKDYNGEYVILPVTMPMVDYFPNGFADRFSERIIPVFLGLTMVKESLSPLEAAYLRRFEPIGCRDERTLQTMRNHGIEAYLHGCITVTLPRRSRQAGNKVYLVDVDEQCLELVPEELRRQAVCRTHLRSDITGDPKEEAQRQYEEYIEQASLVITSLLHCSVPCAAAGIPVILLNSHVSYRKAWLEKLLPIYTPEDAGRIDWNPSPVDWEAHKERVYALTVQRLTAAYANYSAFCDLSWFYEDRKKQIYINDACQSLVSFLAEHWIDPDAPYEYAIWGLTQTAEWLDDYIHAHYRKARLRHVYDSFRMQWFRGVVSEPPTVKTIQAHPSETVFVSTNGAERPARELFEKAGLPRDQQAFWKAVK